jgi:very-short-patch-repair endonuclease
VGTTKKQSLRSRAEQLLYADLTDAGYTPVIGYRFHPERGWKFDLCWPDLSLAVEIDGSGYHTSDKGKRLDQEKRNAALEMRWRVLSYPANSVTTHKRRARIVEQIIRVICGVECPDSAACVLVGE